MKTGVYLIKNKVNNKFYIGSTAKSIDRRFYTHLNSLRKNEHHSEYLQKSWNKYGEDSFIFIILECCDPKDCISREQYYMNTLLPEYNICPTAGSVLGAKFNSSEEVKIGQRARAKKLGLSHKGKILSKEMKEIAKNAAPKKPVIAKNLITGQEIKFESQMEASRKLNIDKRYISGICNGVFKSIKKWTFING